MLDLADEKVEFKGRFGFDLARIRHDDVGQGLAEVGLRGSDPNGGVTVVG